MKRCFISSTFDLETAKAFIGRTMPGKIVRILCEPYEFTIPQTGEMVLLGYSYRYQPDDIPEEVLLFVGLDFEEYELKHAPTKNLKEMIVDR